jgi:hypothetical protein
MMKMPILKRYAVDTLHLLNIMLTILQMGANSGDPRFGDGWEDDDEAGGQPQCTQQ